MRTEYKWSESRIKAVKRRCLAEKTWKTDPYEARRRLLVFSKSFDTAAHFTAYRFLVLNIYMKLPHYHAYLCISWTYGTLFFHYPPPLENASDFPPRYPDPIKLSEAVCSLRPAPPWQLSETFVLPTPPQKYYDSMLFPYPMRIPPKLLKLSSSPSFSL